MSEKDEVVMLQPIAGQRSLFSLSKVVRLGASQVCFTAADIEALRQQLLDLEQTKHQLLTALRKLDCYKLQVQDLQASGIGAAVATLASCHPKPEVAALATSLLQKWRDLVETQLFQPLAYDAQAAGAAPEGDAECPEDLMAAEREAARLERLERRRLRLEQDFMASSSEDEIATASEEEDPDWAPQVGAKGGGRRSKSARVAEAAAAGGGGGATRGVLAVEVVTLPDAPADPPEPQQPSKFKNMHPFFRNLHASAMKE